MTIPADAIHAISDLRDDAALQRAARGAVIAQIKARARFYARRPQALDSLYPGLASGSAHRMIAVAAHLIERHDHRPPRWCGFGGDVSWINARALQLLGRAIRAHRGRG